VHYFSPFVINDHKGSILDRLRLSMSINGLGSSKDKLLHTCRVEMAD
jgi:hypothetical protein